MTVIGIRCSPKTVYYSVIRTNSTSFDFVLQELIIPVSFDLPEKLKYVRKTFLDIFNEYEISAAGIRITEHNAQSPSLVRINIESVIQELIASSKVDHYFTGVSSSICCKLSIPNDGQLRKIIEGEECYRDITEWASFSKEHRECLLVGFSVLNR